MCQEATQQSMYIRLDYDESSINRIDEIIAIGWPDGPPEAPDRQADIFQTWGCFLGEAICQALGAEWVQTESGYDLHTRYSPHCWSYLG